jgi:hypothetical protein
MGRCVFGRTGFEMACRYPTDRNIGVCVALARKPVKKIKVYSLFIIPPPKRRDKIFFFIASIDK